MRRPGSAVLRNSRGQQYLLEQVTSTMADLKILYLAVITYETALDLNHEVNVE